MSSKVESLQRAALKNPVRVSISSSSHQVVSTLLQRYILVPHKYKDLYLIHLLNDNIGHATILFTRTVNETQRLAVLLRTLGFQALPLHGQLSQSNRLGALNKFKAKARDILVATDVAARGLDIPSVDLVVNFDLPHDSETYVHRVGRTARAGKSGKAVSFVTQYDLEIFQRIEHALGKKIPEEEISRDEAMVYAERVGEAQREAIKEMKNIHDLKKSGRGRGGAGGMRGGGRGRGGRGRGRDNMDMDEG
jgi:ATP-dependent RNA helicase DDX47/RRP3